ncbi:MAG: AraC family transcriptional activator of mtrCDE [Saprospiraceae bacterium]|jgi:AraC family transcriptional activator of mtrCDE
MRLLDVPPYLVMRQAQIEEWPWLLRTLEHLSAEYLSQEYGRELTINKLSELFVVQLLRSEFGVSHDIGIVAALRDKRLEKALTAIHADLSQSWTIDSAAQLATMSRSGFAKKFTDVIGVSFYEYLAQIRLRRARYLLRHANASVAQIALQVGYVSELSFIKMFKKI